MDQRYLRQPPRRLFYALGAIFLVAFFFFQFQSSAEPPQGRPWRRPGGNKGPINDVYNNTWGFEKIFVVGLPSRSDRRDGMVLQAALSGIEIEFIDGVYGQDVPDKVIPLEKGAERPKNATIGSWRAHMNAIREVVHRNLSSALILEDDTDWDMRIKDQLYDFALASHALTQPLRGRPGSFMDPTFPVPSPDSPTTLPDTPFNQLPPTQPPTFSPYGDNWDVLWIGHCGMHFPFSKPTPIPKSRIIRLNDATVGPRKHLWTLNIPFTLKDNYPDHTRAYHHAQEGVCSLGYAVSRRGAQKLLHEIGLKPMTMAFDLLLRASCEGWAGRSPGRQCLTTQPGLFQHHRPAGPRNARSDIGNHGDEWEERAMTDMIRWSVRLNAEYLMDPWGTTELVEQF